MKKGVVFSILAFLLVFNQLNAQSYTKELYVGGGVLLRGYSFNLSYGMIFNPKRTGVFSLDIESERHSKEDNGLMNYRSGGASNLFVYGKQNSLHRLDFSYSEKRYLTDKTTENNLSLGLVYGGGFSLGMLKPYYLDLAYRGIDNQFKVVSERYSEANATAFLDYSAIQGRSSQQKGWDELSLAPGINLKTGMVLDWGAQSSFVRTVELGLKGNFYFEPIPLMILDENSAIFLTLYLKLHLGGRG
jgi:hypothetical protein